MKTYYYKYSIVLLILLSPSLTSNAQQKTDDMLLQANYHLFDFWLGEWDVYKNGTDTLVGMSHIISINDGKGLLENYETPNSTYKGKSLNTYNKRTGKWEQYWIDNTGLVLKLAGNFEDGKMVLEGIDGSEGNRISWKAMDNGDVRQVWETLDASKEWKTAFDGIYKPRQSNVQGNSTQ